jgi:hypothetical protein
MPSRRQFHKQVAALAAAGFQVNPGGPPAATAAEALAEVLRLRFGRHLSDEQWRQVRQAVAGNLRLAERLGRVALQNGDEPDFAFAADVTGG